MRTKTLLLTAALSAAGIATSMAQVYSVNAVGYVNTTIVPGYNLISNPLDNKAGNTIGNLFGGPSLPDGTTIYAFKNGTFATPAQVDGGEIVPPTAAALVVNPGEGVFVRNITSQNATVTFVGEVPQGDVGFDIPKGFSIVASKVPQAGTADSLGLKGNDGDTVYQYNEATQNYEQPSISDTGEWIPPLKPLEVGEAFFIKSVNGSRWDRTFSVNQ